MRKVRAEWLEEFATREAHRRIYEAARRAEMSFVNSNFRKDHWQERKVSELREAATQYVIEMQRKAFEKYFEPEVEPYDEKTNRDRR